MYVGNQPMRNRQFSEQLNPGLQGPDVIHYFQNILSHSSSFRFLRRVHPFTYHVFDLRFSSFNLAGEDCFAMYEGTDQEMWIREIRGDSRQCRQVT